MDEIRLFNEYRDVEKYVEVVRQASDRNRISLGFLPATVFADYARRGRLWIAATKSGEYLGHLLFDRKFQKATIVQMYCTEQSRRVGVATKLVTALKDSLTRDGYLSIKAGVAEDLESSNEFWERQGFYIQTRKAGGVTTGRTILVRVHELNTPQLFSRSALALSGEDSLGLSSVASAAPPLYLVDLNILFDVVKRRPQHDAAARLFRAAHSGECRLSISDEMQRELHRESANPSTDPMLCLIDSLPNVKLPSSAAVESLIEDISKIAFPEKKYPAQLSKNDLSDVKHVATAISCGLTGLITRDARLLRVSGVMESRYGIQIVAPTDFGLTELIAERSLDLDVGNGRRVVLSAYAEADDEPVRDLLLQHAVAAHEVVSFWLPQGTSDQVVTRLVAKVDGSVAGYVLWSRFEPGTKLVRIRAVVDEQLEEASNIGALMLGVAKESSARSGLSLLNLNVPERQSNLREVAYRLGFRTTERPGWMAKIAAGTLVRKSAWMSFRESLQEVGGVVLPEVAPDWVSHRQQIQLGGSDGERRYMRIDALEALLSPVLLGLAGRPAVIVPIQPQYAEPLLGHSRQMSLAPKMRSEVASGRLYLADPKCLGRYTKGGLLLFYESGSSGEKAIVAVARVVDTFLINGDDVSEESLAGSVLGVRGLAGIGSAKNKSACVFDNVVVMKRPVSLNHLRKIGIRDSSLVTTRKVTDEQLESILDEGF